MSPRSSVLFSALCLSCAVEPNIGTFIHRDGPRSAAPLQSEQPRSALLAFAEGGDAVVLLDPASGEATAARSLPPARSWDASGLVPLDGTPGVVVLQSRLSEDEPAGDVYSLPISSGDQLGEPTLLGHVEGETSSFASPFGVVTAQVDLGERWRLIPWAGGFTKSVPCGRPLSARVVSRGSTVVRYEALSHGPDGLPTLLDVEVDATGVTRCDPTPIAGHGSLTKSAALVDLGVGYVRGLADVEDGVLFIGALDGPDVVGWVGVELGSSRLDAAIRSRKGAGRVEIVAVGADPGRVAVLELRLRDTGQLELDRFDEQELVGAVDPREGRPSQSLVVLDDMVFVATSAGVEPFELDEAELRLHRSPLRSAVRGPLAAVTLP